MYREKLDTQREERELTLTELAHKAGLGINTTSNIINGKQRPYRRTIHKICQALDCTPDAIGLTDTEVRNG